MKTSHLMLPAMFLALLGAAAIGCSSSDSNGAAGSGGAATGGTGGATGGSGGETGGTGGATGGTGGATGGTGGATGGTGGATGGTGGSLDCATTTEISLTDPVLYDPGDGSYIVYSTVPDPALGDSSIMDEVTLEFYDDGNGDGTGTFDLATAPNDNYDACAQCVLGWEDEDPANGYTPARIYFQSSGTMVVDPSTPPFAGAKLKATLTDVTLMEATIDSTSYSSTFVPNGKCLHITSASVDIGCGNGKIDGSEQCDGTALNNATCQSLGFTSGDLACDSSCGFDLGTCTGWNCSATDLGTFAGTDITQHGDTCTGSALFNAEANGTSCTGYDTLGNELIYTLEVPASTSAQVVIVGAYDSAVWVTSACDDFTGASCIAGDDSVTGNDMVTINNTTSAAVTYYVIVDGYTAGNCGEFDMHVRTPAVVPSAWDSSNTNCDEAYYAAYDGCDCACGAWDPDCDIVGIDLYGCPDDGNTYTCEKPDGTCKAQ